MIMTDFLISFCLKDVTEQSESNPGRNLGGATERTNTSSSMRAEGKLIETTENIRSQRESLRLL